MGRESGLDAIVCVSSRFRSYETKDDDYECLANRFLYCLTSLQPRRWCVRGVYSR
jgi:hypothetical protein